MPLSQQEKCMNYTVCDQVCILDVELLTLCLRPLYLPREFTNIIRCSGCVPPKANCKSTADVIAGSVSRLQSIHPHALVIRVGDFNLCTLDGVLPSFQQIVTCPTKQSTCAIAQWMTHTPRNVSLPWGGQITTSYITCPSTVKTQKCSTCQKAGHGMDYRCSRTAEKLLCLHRLACPL